MKYTAKLEGEGQFWISKPKRNSDLVRRARVNVEMTFVHKWMWVEVSGAGL